MSQPTVRPIDVRPVAERLPASASLDVSALHHRIGEGMRALAQRVYTTFPLAPHEAARPFRSYASPDGAMEGRLEAFSGAPLDWVIDSFIANPRHGFCNHHLTLWLDESVSVPHLAFAVGTIPQLFFFCDLVPRSDLWVNTTELDRFHARFNERALAVAADPRFRPFVSREIYIRQAISPVGICIEGDATPEAIDFVLGLAGDTLGPWLDWVKSAEPTPRSERPALRERDERVRRTICWRDPANVVAERVLGKTMTDDLVRLLSGEARRKGTMQ